MLASGLRVGWDFDLAEREWEAQVPWLMSDQFYSQGAPQWPVENPSLLQPQANATDCTMVDRVTSGRPHSLTKSLQRQAGQSMGC